MADATDITPPNAQDEHAAERITDIDVAAEMEGSFLEYAYSVIYSRALPDARDGLKPVQRRILYMMTEMGLSPERGHVKSARVVGEVMGKLHPHGDASIYDALVRLAQDFAMRLQLVDGHGNFGSLDDGPAAARYTEARLAGAALAMTASLDEDVVDFVPNYDNQIMQPEVLPAAVPNLLVNGASGIAVGMATNLAPHNLVEVVAGAKHLLQNPTATVDELMEFIPGPDLPGGGTIVGLSGIKDAYRSGRGAFRTRAKVSITQLAPRRTGLVITELPYLIGPERVIEKVKQGVEAKKLAGISDIVDLSDRKNGLKLVITLKTGFSPEAVLETLYRYTPLEESFSINSVALVNGQPQTLGLREMLRVFLDHRLKVVERRSQFRLRKKRERLHLVAGLLIAILDIDEVIQVIRGSDDATSARSRLMQVFDLSQLQAEYILELRLRRLTKFSRVELEAERDQLEQEIARLLEILGDPKLLQQLVSEELDAAAADFGTPRRTLLTGAVARAARASSDPQDLQLADTPCTVLLSASGRALRIDRDPEAPSDTKRATPRATKHGAVLARVDASVRQEMGAIMSDGSLHRFTPVDLPLVPAAAIAFAAGVRLSDYIGLQTKQVRVIGITALHSEVPLALCTRQGTIKRVMLSDLPAKAEFPVIALKPGDELVAAMPASDSDEFALVTSDAQLLRFAASTVRAQGRNAGGMAGIKLAAGATVISAHALPAAAAAKVVTIACGTDPNALVEAAVSSAKVSEWAEIPAKGRATGGVRVQRFLKGEDRLCAAWVGTGEPRALNREGQAVALPTTVVRRDASGTTYSGMIKWLGAAP